MPTLVGPAKISGPLGICDGVTGMGGLLPFGGAVIIVPGVTNSVT